MSVIDETVLSLSFVTLVIKDQQRKWLSNAFSKEIGEEFAAKKLHVELQSEKGDSVKKAIQAMDVDRNAGADAGATGTPAQAAGGCEGAGEHHRAADCGAACGEGAAQEEAKKMADADHVKPHVSRLRLCCIYGLIAFHNSNHDNQPEIHSHVRYGLHLKQSEAKLDFISRPRCSARLVYPC